MTNEKWITIKGTPVKLDKEGNPVAGPKELVKAIHSQSLPEKRKALHKALKSLSEGKNEETVPNLRDDLEQYGGTNDITIVKGNAKKGLIHIAQRHGVEVVSGVLEAVVEGKVLRFTRGNKTVILSKDNYEAVLALEENGNKKTWLLTGFDLTKAKDEVLSGESGKVCTRHAPTQHKPISSRPILGADSNFTCIITKILRNASMNKNTHFALDKASQRHKDENGFLHVAVSNISKETVNPYFGREIPGWEEKGLDPEKIYYGYRSGKALLEGAHTFNGLPLLRGHYIEHAESPQREHRVGSLGTNSTFLAPYLQNSLSVTDAEAIRKIESGQRVELSAAYAYDPVFEKNEFQGESYDFIMTNIRGNHVALVEEGRAGSDVVVADSKPQQLKGKKMTSKERWQRVLASARNILAMDANPNIEQAETELEKGLLAIQKVEAEEEGINPEAVGLEDLQKTPVSPISKTFLDPEIESKLVEKKPEAAKAQDAEDPKVEKASKVDETVKKALDKCGLDSENPEFQKAFAEGVKYGESLEKNPTERKKIDGEHESENAKKAMDAQIAMRNAEKAVFARVKEMQDAAKFCAPFVGEVNLFAFDSAEEIYLYACKHQGVNATKHTAKDVVQALSSPRQSTFNNSTQFSCDSKFKSRFGE